MIRYLTRSSHQPAHQPPATRHKPPATIKPDKADRPKFDKAVTKARYTINDQP